jgi:ankyrin repeat protein
MPATTPLSYDYPRPNFGENGSSPPPTPNTTPHPSLPPTPIPLILNPLSSETIRTRRTAPPYDRALDKRLYNCIQYGDSEEKITSLILAGANVNTYHPDTRYGFCLQAAASTGNYNAASLLLHHEADMNATGGFYHTALQGAAQEDSHKIVELLLEAGADVNESGGRYGSALAAAKREGNGKSVELLLQWGAEVEDIVDTVDVYVK